jgi:glycerol-3-phosphate dehydrogenase
MVTGPALHAREALLDRLRRTPRWDIAIVGGGATGCGVALDAATRGFSVMLV